MTPGLRNYLIVFSLFAAVAIGAVVTNPSVLDKPIQYSQRLPTRSEAQAACEQFVRDRVTTPGSARFSPVGETTISGFGNTWQVSGWVDAQNAFGAQIRSAYDCRTHLASEWMLDSLDIALR